jgi:hypothetical protein
MELHLGLRHMRQEGDKCSIHRILRRSRVGAVSNTKVNFRPLRSKSTYVHWDPSHVTIYFGRTIAKINLPPISLHIVLLNLSIQNPTYSTTLNFTAAHLLGSSFQVP